MQGHVAAPELAGLITVREARRHLEDLEALWRGRLDRFGETLATTPEEAP